MSTEAQAEPAENQAGIRQISYSGFEKYIAERADVITSQEKRQLLACISLDFAFKYFKEHLRDKRMKRGLYDIYEIRSGLGVIGVASASKSPIFFTRKIGVSEAMSLFRASICLRNFRRPMTLFQYVEGIPQAIGYLLVKYARDDIEAKEILASKSGSLPSRLLRGLRKRRIEQYLYTDPLITALNNCLAKYYEEHRKYLWYYTSDLFNVVLRTDKPVVVLADGGQADSLLIGYKHSNCPLNYLTVFNVKKMYVAHASDVA